MLLGIGFGKIATIQHLISKCYTQNVDKILLDHHLTQFLINNEIFCYCAQNKTKKKFSPHFFYYFSFYVDHQFINFRIIFQMYKCMQFVTRPAFTSSVEALLFYIKRTSSHTLPKSMYIFCITQSIIPNRTHYSILQSYFTAYFIYTYV